MTHFAVQQIEKKFIQKKVPTLRPGYTVKVHQKIKEGEKERIQIFEGLVIGINAGHGASKMFTVRKVVEGIGVEKIFPMHSPIISKIEVTKTSKVRRAKLFYMRGLAGKSTRLRTDVGLTGRDEKHSKKKAALVEAMGVDLNAAPAASADNVEPLVAPETEAPATTVAPGAKAE